MSTRAKTASITWDTVLQKNPRERLKAEKDPLHILDELDDLIRRGYEDIPEEDIVRLQWYGISHDKPRIGYFMVRIKIPNGRLTPAQLACIARLARKFGNYAEITTRQCIQLHWIRLDDMPDVLAQLHTSGLTTLGGEGDAVRNITGCPVAGIDADELFDPNDDLHRLVAYFYDATHRAYFNLPRKVKLTLAACPVWCNLPEIHDIAFIGTTVDSRPGYAVAIGGGLSTNPRTARPLNIFVTGDQVVDVARAILDIWSETLENRLSFIKARLKFFVDRIGVDAYRARLIARLGWEPSPAPPLTPPQRRHFHMGVHPQKQPGYVYIGVPVVCGRMRGEQMEQIATLADAEHLEVRLTQRQNLILSNVPEDRTAAVIERLHAWGFPVADASEMRKVSIACTGDPFCNFSAGSSKDLLEDILTHLESRLGPIDDVVIHLDGCPHACAQHWIGDIGLQASYRRLPNGTLESALMIILGGGMHDGIRIGRVVAKRVSISDTRRYLENLIAYYRASGPWPSFQAFTAAHTDEQLLRIMQTGRPEPVPETVAAAEGQPRLLTVRMGAQTWEVEAPIQVRTLLERLQISPEMLVVVRNGERVQMEDWLHADDDVELIRNISGGMDAMH